MKLAVVLWTMCFTVCPTFFLTAQEPVSPQYDADIQKLINKVERDDDEPSGYANEFKPENDMQKAAGDVADRYLRALVEENWNASYQLLCKVYRDKVTMDEYRGQSRLISKRGLLKDLIFEGDSCALARGFLWGEAPGGMGTLKIPMKIFLLLEEGEWRVFRNPYENHMGVSHPRGRHIKYPCEFKWDEFEKEGQESDEKGA